MNYRLVKDGDPILLQVAEYVDHSTGEREEVIKVMRDVMLFNNQGIGIAAPQVGASLRIIMVKIGSDILTMINPKIIRRWGKKVSVIEGETCLSYPGRKAFIKRDCFIQVIYSDENLKKQKRKFRQLDSVVVQHEIDHINGITIASDRS